MTRAVYPGSFDPFHHGHLDIARRAGQIFDEVIVAIYDKPSKKLLFSTEERVDLVRRSTLEIANLSIVTYTGLTIDCVKKVDAQVLIRGLRNVADFQFEHQLGWANSHLAPSIETCCLFCSKEFAYLSSTILKEVASLNGDYSGWASPSVQEALAKKFARLALEASESNLEIPVEVSESAVARSDGKLSYRN